MFEFQTAMSELTGLPVSNAALYEGPSSVASAAYLAIGATGRRKLVASRGVHPHSRESLVTYGAGYGTELVETGLEAGVTDAAALAEAIDDETAAVFLQQPNFLGAVEDVEALAAKAKRARSAGGGRLRPDRPLDPEAARASAAPTSRSARDSRSATGSTSADRPSASSAHRRAPPADARAGSRGDDRRRRPPGLRPHPADARAAHSPGEGDPQHLHRPGAQRPRRDDPPRLARQARGSSSSASCSSSGPAYAGGPGRGRRGGAAPRGAGGAEFGLRSRRPVSKVLERCAAEGIGAGYPLGREYPEHEDGLLVALTERRSRADIDRLAEVLGRAVADLRGAKVAEGGGEHDGPGATAHRRRRHPDAAGPRRRSSSARSRAAGPRCCPRPDVPERPAEELIPKKLLRERPAELPEISEPEIVRHYNRISRRNFDLDTGFYPLGSCTMKHNPSLNERVAALPGHARLHPAQEPKRAQGALELMWLLQQSLVEICGLPHVSLQPSAGSHGELAGCS